MLKIKELINKLLKCAYTTGSSGNWTWRKYADGTYDAWFNNGGGGSTGSLTAFGNGAGGYSPTFTHTLPTEIGSTDITWFRGSCYQSSYLMDIWAVSKTANSVTNRYVRYGATAAASGVSFMLEVHGTWSQ